MHIKSLEDLGIDLEKAAKDAAKQTKKPSKKIEEML